MNLETSSANLQLVPVPEPELSPKLQLTPIGIQFHGPLSFEEWSALAPQLGSLARSVGFLLGDWLVYGQEHFSDQPTHTGKSNRVTSERYDFACKTTGIDRQTLRDYAYVSRNVPHSLRNDQLQWEHHKIVAKLPPEEQSHWLTLAANPEERLSARRLRASILRGEIVPVEELALPAAEQAIPNHITPINRLSSWWKQSGGTHWLQTRSPEQLAAMLRDFEPILQIIQQLQTHHDHPTR